MTVTNGYASLSQLKGRLNIQDSPDDSILEALLTAISRQIEDYTGHRFYATTQTRVYDAVSSSWLLLPRGHDLLSASSVTTDLDYDRVYETVWASTDYDLEPANNPLDGLPYWALCVRPMGNNAFPVGVPRGVQITGSWGFSSTTPAVVQESCLLQCQMAHQAVLASGNSQAGAGEYAQTISGVGLHPFVRRMLDPFRDVGGQ